MKKLPLFVALDTATREQAVALAQKTKDYAQAYKIGPRLFLAHGPELIGQIKNHNSQVFLDFKFYDIPSSTVEAVRAAFEMGADFVTVHASAGPEALQLLSQFEKEARQKKFFQILCVTVLSSAPDSKSNQNKIFQLAESVCRSGLKGLVCSPWEARALKQKYPDMFLATPGIRLKGENPDDQKRFMPPLQALREGSSALIMGRSLARAEDPEKLLRELYDSFTAGNF